MLPAARSPPALSAPAIEGYLKAGGDLLALRAPAWESPRYLIRGLWISSFAELGTAPNPFGNEAPPLSSVPLLESLSPAYQFFDITTPVLVRADHQKESLEPWERAAEGAVLLNPAAQSSAGAAANTRAGLLGLHPRPRGIGFNQDRPFRWEPLLGAYDSRTGDYRGAVAALVVHLAPPLRGGAWAIFTPMDDDMPSTGLGVANHHFFEHWLGRGAYDPAVIERDLGRVKAMNLNAVSIFIDHESLRAQNLLDFFRRCQRLGLRVNQSLRPGTPMDFQWKEMKELIEFYRMAGNDLIFVDVWEPEAYGRIGDWERVKAGEFTAAYARLCDPDKPLVWAEMGYNAWDANHNAPDPEKQAFQARFSSDFYRMLRESGADGVFFWWYPGGFRLNENSDFGILNPDGTDRPVTQVIRREGARFLEAPKPGKPDYWIRVSRDRDARGLYGIYAAVEQEFWAAQARGQRPGLRRDEGRGTRDE